MHIAFLIGHFPPGPFGGAERQAESWSRILADRHQITVVTRREPRSQPREEHRGAVHVLRMPVSRWPIWRTIADRLAIERAISTLSPRPDVLLCFQTFVSGWAGVRVGRSLGIPVVLWIRGEEEYRLSRSWRHRFLSPRVWARATRVLVQSEANREDMLTELSRHEPALEALLRGRLDIVPNGLELPTATFARGRDVLAVGRLIPEKGMDVVIEAMRGIHAPLVIAGDGPERGALERRAAAAGVECRFTGFLPPARLDELYRSASCVVLAARRGEGLPNVVLEAMAHARPVIATRCAGTRDLVVDRVNGRIVPAGDVPATAAAIREVLEEGPAARGLAAAARASAEAFAWTAVRPKLERVLEQAVLR